jgi:phosphate transport system substrate-binding protein
MLVRLRAACWAAMLAAVTTILPFTARAETLSLGGTGGAIPMLRQVGAIFAAQYAIDLRILDSLGSGGGIAAAGDGVLDVAVSGRPPTAGEVVAGFSVPLIVRTPYALATSYPTPPSVGRIEVGRLFADIRAKWPDGTPVRIVLRPTSESDNAVLFNLFPGTEAAVVSARRRVDVSVAPTDQDNQEFAARIPGSLIGTTYTQLLLEHRGLNSLRIDGIPASPETLANGSYPYEKRLWFVLPAHKTAIAAKFIEYLRSPEGELVLHKAGILPLPE